MNAWPRWRRTWLRDMRPSSLRPAAPIRHALPRQRQPQFPSYSSAALIRSGRDLSPASIGRAATSPAFGSALEAKRLEMLHELVPKASTVAAIINPSYPSAKTLTQEVQEAASHLNLKLILLPAEKESDLEPAFMTFVRRGARALLVTQDAFLVSLRDKFAELTARHAIPAIYPFRDYVTAGGLVSFGPDFADGYRQAGIYVGKILKGAKPADLPIVQPTKFELVFNLKAAKLLAITIPPSLLAIADDVIE